MGIRLRENKGKENIEQAKVKNQRIEQEAHNETEVLESIYKLGFTVLTMKHP